jgi:hypothetical protein
MMISGLFEIVIPLWLYLVRNPNDVSIDYGEYQRVIEQSIERYKPLGIELKLKHVEIVDDIEPELWTILDQSRRINRWRAEFKKRKLMRPRRMMHVVFPPMAGGYMGGLAYTCSYRTRHFLSISNMKIATKVDVDEMGNIIYPDGMNRLLHDETVFEHESRHTLGASHDPSGVNIMRSDALYLVDEFFPLPTFDKAKAEIKACLKAPKNKRIRREQ